MMKKARKQFFSLSLGGVLMVGGFSHLDAAKLSDVINNASIDGFGFGRIHALEGRDGEGARYQFRFKPTITSGAVYGMSVSAGLFFSKGSSTPDSNASDNDIGGSRGQTIDSLVDRFNIGDFYITLDGKEALDTKTTIRFGQKTPGTPFNDNNLDRALGIFIDNKDIDMLNYGFQWWDSWMSDDIYISLPGVASNGAGIGNNMFMAYVRSSAAFTKDTKISYNFWYGGVHRWISAMIFADTAYTLDFDNQSLSVTAQLSYASISNKSYIYSSSQSLRNLYGGDKSMNSNKDWYAKNRGMYNIRVDYKYKLTETSSEDREKAIGFFGASAGLAGSFGDGFGTLIDNTGGLKLGGHLWNSYAGTEANGFGILGVGAFKGSSIIVPYLKAEAGYKKLNTAINMAYVKASHFFYLKKGSTNGANLNTVADSLYGSKNHIKAASFLDIALSAAYKFTDNINVLTVYGYAFGNPQFGRLRFQVNYVF